MEKYNKLQKDHYTKQYSNFMKMKTPEEEDLFGWCKWYPLMLLDDFFSTLSGQTLLVTCCGAGRELSLFHKHEIVVTATDLAIEHLDPLCRDGIIHKVEIQDAQKLTYENESFDYGFVNAGLHHLVYPHAGLIELLRCSRKGVILIESQDSILHAITRWMGRRADYEPAGNYVYRWKKREIEKICFSAHLYSFAVKTAFLPIISKLMSGCKGVKKTTSLALLRTGNRFLAPVGNIFIAILFKQAPVPEQYTYLENMSYKYKKL